MAGLCLACAALCHAGETSRLVTNAKSGKQQTVVVYGTSLTAGGAWVQQLQEVLDGRYPGKTKFINSGKAAMWSNWGKDNLDELVIGNKPGTVFIEFAINDAFLNYKTSVAQAQSNLEDMVDRILQANPACEIVLMVMNPPTGVHLQDRPNFRDYYQMYRDVAKKRKLLCIDHCPNWEKILNNSPELFLKYVPDGIHPSEEGCKIVVVPEIVKAMGIKAP